MTAVSKKYAKALLSVGQEDGNYEKYATELQEFSQFYFKNEELRKVVINPVYAMEERKGVLDKVLDQAGSSDIIRNFLTVLLQKKRIEYVDRIAEQYRNLADEASNIARATVVTSGKLKEESMSRIKRTLEDRTSKKIKIHVEEDSSIIGGIIIKVGNTILDGSIKGQLEKLRDTLKGA